ncbi:MAG: hypothetical protein HY332_14105 [Chloroflexi bacterium]|nr:hypothetical protein [Chloroflexota bacterium]
MIATMISETPLGQAIVQAAVQRRVGAPVYLRYAAEAGRAGRGDNLVDEAAGAVDFARRTLGEPVDVYAAGVRREDGAWAHLALTVRFRDGSVALLGLGAAPERAAGAVGEPADSSLLYRRYAPPSVLLLGDRGAVERYPSDGPDITVRDTSGARRDDSPAVKAHERYAAAIRRSLAGGRPEPLAPINQSEAADGER